MNRLIRVSANTLCVCAHLCARTHLYMWCIHVYMFVCAHVYGYTFLCMYAWSPKDSVGYLLHLPLSTVCFTTGSLTEPGTHQSGKTSQPVDPKVVPGSTSLILRLKAHMLPCLDFPQYWGCKITFTCFKVSILSSKQTTSTSDFVHQNTIGNIGLRGILRLAFMH